MHVNFCRCPLAGKDFLTLERKMRFVAQQAENAETKRNPMVEVRIELA